MLRFELRSLRKKINHLLHACEDWLRGFGLFGLLREGEGEGAPVDAGDGFRWVFDPERQIWLMEMSYSFRSFEYRLQAGEAEAPSGIRALRRILGSGP
jgi:hypothetical protein